MEKKPPPHRHAHRPFFSVQMFIKRSAARLYMSTSVVIERKTTSVVAHLSVVLAKLSVTLDTSELITRT
jgi:hypothetical protein